MTDKNTYWVIKDVITGDYFGIMDRGEPIWIYDIDQAAVCLKLTYAKECLNKIKKTNENCKLVKVTRKTKEI